MTARWGILGGIFDPVHLGHLAIAEQTREALDLERVLFVPAGQPVHRDMPHAEAEHRVRMLELAVADNDAFELDAREVDSTEPSYTADTLEALAAGHPDVEFVLIVSSETAALMPTTWHRTDRILELAEVAVVSRLGHADISREWVTYHYPGREERFLRVQTTHLGHSSTAIRTLVAAGRSVRYLLPDAVRTYIGDHGLYGSSRAA